MQKIKIGRIVFLKRKVIIKNFASIKKIYQNIRMKKIGVEVKIGKAIIKENGKVIISKKDISPQFSKKDTSLN